ncbi:MAG: hypothetical protein ABJN05_15065 [Sulfitobacter dubius]
MGRAKALLMEMEEAQWEGSDISFHCPSCEDEVDGFTELPVVYHDADGLHLPVSVACSVCNTSFEGWVQTDWYSCAIELDGHPEILINTSPVQGSFYEDEDHYYFEWLEQQERVSRPVYNAFYTTIGEIESLASDLSDDNRSQMLARMLFAQSITALEVFLADSLILTVGKSAEAQAKLLRSNELGIGNTQFKLAEAIGVEEFAKERLKQHLHSVSYHNLRKVSNLFRYGLGFDILPQGEDLDRLQTAIKMRHDCVHRNGIDRLSGQRHDISKVYIMSLSKLLLNMVRSIDDKVCEFESPS